MFHHKAQCDKVGILRRKRNAAHVCEEKWCFNSLRMVEYIDTDGLLGQMSEIRNILVLAASDIQPDYVLGNVLSNSLLIDDPSMSVLAMKFSKNLFSPM